MIARFLRKGGEGTYTRVFSNLETAIQKNITDHISFGDETPLVAYLKDAYWVIITMQCLYLKDNAGRVQQLKFEDCKGISYLLAENKQHRADATVKYLATVWNDKRIVFAIESGKPFSGIYQVLVWLIPHSNEVPYN
jgi:hypothetical protein